MNNEYSRVDKPSREHSKWWPKFDLASLLSGICALLFLQHQIWYQKGSYVRCFHSVGISLSSLSASLKLYPSTYVSFKVGLGPPSMWVVHPHSVALHSSRSRVCTFKKHLFFQLKHACVCPQRLEKGSASQMSWRCSYRPLWAAWCGCREPTRPLLPGAFTVLCYHTSKAMGQVIGLKPLRPESQ